jgi:UDP-N-acetylglucosamine transferase subunit ALG13
MADEHGFDAVIADNRYGLYHSTIPSVFITHQLTIKSSLGKWTERILQKRNYRFINRFTECWVPDVDEKNNLAGELSHPEKKPTIPLHYIGVLSRFEIKSIQKEKNHLLIILSGPEPQRSLLENKIINEVSNYNGTATIVRGLPGSASVIPSTNIIHFYNHLPSVELNKEMQQAEYIISRSGYSTIMDVVKLQKKSILIPTPGQTEQKYLANYLLQKQIAFCVSQKEFSLTKALQKAKQFSYHLPTSNNEQLLGKVIMNFIASMNG